jgi:Zn-dependent protease with chaperone function
MRAIYGPICVVALQGFAPGALADMDGHSLEAVRQALESPIPVETLDQARRLDEQTLRSGMAMGAKVSLVTGERLQHTQAIVQRVLTAAGEHPQSWVVRVFDTDPKIPNAFVSGGKYIYVFTGIVDAVRSDSELAVIVGHEMGHSILKHELRRNSDVTSSLANLAILIGQLKGGSRGATAGSIGKALHSGYSREDEREADAFGVIAAWRAGFDPLRGADFFTRLEQAATQQDAAEAKQQAQFKDQALQVKSQCETWTAQWNAGQLPHTQQNADAINQRCNAYREIAVAYNTELAQQATQAAQAKIMDDHPESQERIAAITAETDWLHGARSLASLQSYPRIHTVIVALLQANSAAVAGLGKHSDPTPIVAANSSEVTASQVDPADTTSNLGRDKPTAMAASEKPNNHAASPFVTQWNALDDALANGVITKAEYDTKVATLLARNRSH